MHIKQDSTIFKRNIFLRNLSILEHSLCTNNVSMFCSVIVFPASPPPGSHLPDYGYNIIGHGQCSFPQFAQVVKMFRMFPRNLIVTSYNPWTVFPVHASADTHIPGGSPGCMLARLKTRLFHRMFGRNGKGVLN